jgi:NAD(P)-dependent dehydrogenase (short-subunit alcohol dehydrogenase family)
MSGGSRGIGLAIALRAARDGANIVLLAKTGEPHPRLEGTVSSAARLIEEAGGAALPIVGDVRRDEDVRGAVEAALERFGGIDAVINNASAIDLSRTPEVDMKRYDLMADVNVRGSFMLSKFSLGALRRSANPHILTLSPPLNLDPKWAGMHLAYTMAKYGMSLTTLGLAEGAARRGDRRELAVAEDSHRHRGHPQHARRGGHRQGGAQPGDRRRRRARGAGPQLADLHRQLLHRRGGAPARRA